ncbi:hypothetical protein [Streptomyces sp. NPDC056549]|uniref:hypothetical protein n=1 Tax=Streptomyces sp. NPDC056549 TaxID=3345864 RepID=UPI0036D13E88
MAITAPRLRCMSTVGAAAASLVIGAVLAGCGASTEESPGSLRESLASRSGTGFEVLSLQQEKELGVDNLNPEALTVLQVKDLLYLNAKGDVDNNRVKQWVFPDDGELAGRTSHFSIAETGKPAVIIVPKGFNVREVTYVDNVDNKIESDSFYKGEDNTPKTGSWNTTRVFWGVDSIIMDVRR